MSQQHTLGWRGTGNGFVRDYDGNAVCSVYGFEGNAELDDTMIERERLLAAAPRMLEALKKAHRFIAAEYGDPKSQALEGEHVSKDARAIFLGLSGAIAKAEGGAA